ncbi:hypothetical protein ND748_17825 [Frankia sp. AiPs1]|uniref:hypothetical protein n=1 Tax=Frankia sp. AiPs1 TaxID=573493 RepID=UPI00204467DD|nr:hypothetical protein [Frankia sp. AiPs1]MCM3923514.1 hypothetical protein [Frankia sp. AiPs1]
METSQFVPIGQRRVIFTADIKGFGQMSGPAKKHAQNDLADVMDHAYRAARLSLEALYAALEGDSVIAVIPAGLPEADTVAALVRGAHNRLRTLNRGRPAEGPLRLRFACGQGIIEAGGTGLGGDAIVEVCRIRDAEPTRAALRDHPAAAAVLALTEDIYRSTVATSEHELQPEQMVAVRVVEKELTTTAWLWVPDHPPAFGPQGDPTGSRPDGDPTGPGPGGRSRPVDGGPAGGARDGRCEPFIGPGDLVPGERFG